MKSTLRIEVSYCQFSVFPRSLAQPFNAWTDRHVDQGFAWRPESVSFRTLIESGAHLVEIDVVDYVNQTATDAVRIIEVPFEVPHDGTIEVGSISDSALLIVPAGPCLLRCELFPVDEGGVAEVRLVFARKAPIRFAIVRADSALVTNGEMLKSANPA